jgi:ABC-type glycerol-3-phosphate transport system substrate-binding protein
MKVKKYMLMFWLILTLVATASCSEENIDTKVRETKDSKAEIKIDVMGKEYYLLNAIKEFNEAHKDVKIGYDTVTRNDEYKNKYITKLVAGEGPDIIRIEPWLLSAVNKVTNSGILYDLNEVINKDKSFKISDYNQKVLDGGIINGKRFFVPVCYTFPTFYSKYENLKENGVITEGSKWTLGYMADKAQSYIQKNANSGKCFMIYNGNFVFSSIVKISGLNLVDYEKKEAKFMSPEFIDLLNIYQKLYPTVKEKTEFNVTSSGSGDSKELTSDCSELDNDTALIMGNQDPLVWFRDGLNKKLNNYLFPQYNDKRNILIETVLSFAINSKSAYKNEAYEFLKLVLSEKFQDNSIQDSFMLTIPVNNNAYLNNVNFYISNLGNTQPVNGEYDAEKRKEQVKEQYQEIQRISVCDTIDAQVYDIIDSEAKNFIDGKYSAEKTAEIIQEKVMLYLNE